MYPHERSLVKKHAGRPFAIIGVNSDRNRTELKPRLQEEAITWRSFWNGPEGNQGRISTRWNVRGWPTLYLVDHRGIIRKKWRGNRTDGTLGEAIEKLVTEAEKKE